MLKPQDVLVACKLFTIGNAEWTFLKLAASLSIAPSETHASVQRCQAAGLLSASGYKVDGSKRRLFELCSVGAPMIFYPVRGAVVTGLPTSVHATCLAGLFPDERKTSYVKVWPHAAADAVSGESLLPLYPTVPRAACRDEVLYKLMALVDVVRVGEPSDRRVAVEHLKTLILKGER